MKDLFEKVLDKFVSVASWIVILGGIFGFAYGVGSLYSMAVDKITKPYRIEVSNLKAELDLRSIKSTPWTVTRELTPLCRDRQLEKMVRAALKQSDTLPHAFVKQWKVTITATVPMQTPNGIQEAALILYDQTKEGAK